MTARRRRAGRATGFPTSCGPARRSHTFSREPPGRPRRTRSSTGRCTAPARPRRRWRPGRAWCGSPRGAPPPRGPSIPRARRRRRPRASPVPPRRSPRSTRPARIHPRRPPGRPPRGERRPGRASRPRPRRDRACPPPRSPPRAPGGPDALCPRHWHRGAAVSDGPLVPVTGAGPPGVDGGAPQARVDGASGGTTGRRTRRHRGRGRHPRAWRRCPRGRCRARAPGCGPRDEALRRVPPPSARSPPRSP